MIELVDMKEVIYTRLNFISVRASLIWIPSCTSLHHLFHGNIWTHNWLAVNVVGLIAQLALLCHRFQARWNPETQFYKINILKLRWLFSSSFFMRWPFSTCDDHSQVHSLFCCCSFFLPFFFCILIIFFIKRKWQHLNTEFLWLHAFGSLNLHFSEDWIVTFSCGLNGY